MVKKNKAKSKYQQEMLEVIDKKFLKNLKISKNTQKKLKNIKKSVSLKKSPSFYLDKYQYGKQT